MDTDAFIIDTDAKLLKDAVYDPIAGNATYQKSACNKRKQREHDEAVESEKRLSNCFSGKVEHPGKLDPYYPSWGTSAPIPDHFYGCISALIVEARSSLKGDSSSSSSSSKGFVVPFRDEESLGPWVSRLPTGVLEMIFLATPWLTLLCMVGIRNRFLRFLALRRASPLNVAYLVNNPINYSHYGCDNKTRIYERIAKVAVMMKAPWVLLRLLATSHMCHYYASGCFVAPLMHAAVECDCPELVALAIRRGVRLHANVPNEPARSWRNDHIANAAAGSLSTCVYVALRNGNEPTALKLLTETPPYGFAWPLRETLRRACAIGAWKLARVLVLPPYQQRLCDPVGALTGDRAAPGSLAFLAWYSETVHGAPQ